MPIIEDVPSSPSSRLFSSASATASAATSSSSLTSSSLESEVEREVTNCRLRNFVNPIIASSEDEKAITDAVIAVIHRNRWRKVANWIGFTSAIFLAAIVVYLTCVRAVVVFDRDQDDDVTEELGGEELGGEKVEGEVLEGEVRNFPICLWIFLQTTAKFYECMAVWYYVLG